MGATDLVAAVLLLCSSGTRAFNFGAGRGLGRAHGSRKTQAMIVQQRQYHLEMSGRSPVPSLNQATAVAVAALQVNELRLRSSFLLLQCCT